MKKLLSVMAVIFLAASVKAADLTLWLSSSTATSETGVTIDDGAVHLHKIIVSSAGVASGLVVYDSKDSADQTNIKAAIDTTSRGEYLYDIYLSSGLTYDNYGTSPAAVEFLYWRSQRGGYRVWSSTFVNTAESNTTIITGAGIVHKVIVASATAAGTGLDLFNAVDGGAAQGNRIIRTQGDAIQDVKYDVYFSSGLTRTNTGTAGFTVIYKDGAP